MLFKIVNMRKLKKGDKAPPFTAKDYRGKKIEQNDYQGKKLLLSFHAFGSCPFCNLRVRELSNTYKNWDTSKIEMVHVFPSSEEIIGKFAGSSNPPFSIISDPNKNLFETYRVGKSVLGMFKGFLKVSKLMKAFKVVNMFNSLSNNDSAMHQMPADFLIDENGFLLEAFYANATSENLSIEKIESYINKSTSKAA